MALQNHFDDVLGGHHLVLYTMKKWKYGTAADAYPGHPFHWRDDADDAARRAG